MLLADTSAWERAGDASVREQWTEALLIGRTRHLATRSLRAVVSTRDAESFAALEARLAALRDVALTASVQRAAMSAQRELAELGPRHHRVPLPDLLIAAVAQERGLEVLHDDRHFETLQRAMSFTGHRLLAAGSGSG